MKKIIFTILISFSLMASVNADSGVGGKVIKYGTIAAGVGLASIAIQNAKNKNISTSIYGGDVNKKVDDIFDDLSLVDNALNDSNARKNLLSDINNLLNNDKLTLTNRESLLSLKKKLEEKDRYLEKPNPYLKGDSVVENKRELPISEIENPYLIETPYGDMIDTSTDFPINPPRSYDEYLTLKQDSTILAKNLGGARKGYAAHHIVPASDKNAQNARDILKKHGIDINDAINGVFLPTDVSNSNGEIVHKGRHPIEYSKEINRIINNADLLGGKTRVSSKLMEINDKLLSVLQSGEGWTNILKGIQ